MATMKRFWTYSFIIILTFVLGVAFANTFGDFNNIFEDTPGVVTGPSAISAEPKPVQIPVATDNKRCYKLTPRSMVMDTAGHIHCEGGEIVRIPNCR